MKMRNLIKRYSFISLLIILAVLSILTAVITYRYYAYIARGIVGFVMLYLLYYFGRHTNLDVSMEAWLSDPQKGKYLLLAFIVPLISGWAGFQIVAAFLFYLQK
jgi:uncharacterized membrane protein YfcA